jgi:hypothetical protein
MWGRVDRALGSDGAEQRWYHNRLSGRMTRLTFLPDGTFEANNGKSAYRFGAADVRVFADGIARDVEQYPPAVEGW